MQTHKKELIFNAMIMSMVLALLIAGIGARMEAENPDLVTSVDWILSFIIYWLVLYIYHLVVSIINYAIGQLIRNFTVRLLLFNVVGLFIAILAWYFLSSGAFLAAYSSFLVFTIVALISRKWRAGVNGS